MIDERERWTLDGKRVREAMRAPAVGEVIVRVCGSALGVAPGAEVAGEVVACGESATEWFGRTVVVPRLLPCGECERCRRGRAASCAARAKRDGLASHEIVPARFLCAIDTRGREPALWPEGTLLHFAATLADAAAAPHAALARLGLGPGELCAIVGATPRGLFAVAIARAAGAEAIVIDGDATRRERAIAIGARAALSTERAPDETRAELAEHARTLGLRDVAPRVVETTAGAAGRARALALVEDGGAVALLDGGDDANARPQSWERFCNAEATVVGATAAHPDLLPELCALAARGALPFAQIARAITVEEIPTALEARGAELAIVVPSAR